MKNTLATFIALVIAVATLHAFKVMKHGTVTGSIYPADGAHSIRAINGTDTTVFRPGNGSFNLTLKPGSWKFLVNAKAPLKNTVVNVNVKEGQTAGLGIITLYP